MQKKTNNEPNESNNMAPNEQVEVLPPEIIQGRHNDDDAKSERDEPCINDRVPKVVVDVIDVET